MKVSLFKELQGIFDSSYGMLMLAIYHGQVTVDGYVVKPTDDMRWTVSQLGGRMAKIGPREGRLFGMSQRCRTPTTPTPDQTTPVGS